MKYYLHSVDTMDDEKVTELFRRFGYEGTGLFHAILEKLAKQEKPVKTDTLKYQLKVGKRLLKCWNFLEEIGLISSNNGETFNKQLLNFSEKYQIKKEKNAKKISEWRKKQEDTESVTGYEPSCNHPKVKKSKVNESKVNLNINEFAEKTPNSVHSEIIKIYSSWYENLVGVKYKFNGGSDGNAVKSIIAYLKNANSENQTDEIIFDSFIYILSKYDTWDEFYKKQLKLSQINSNLTNIIANINGIGKSNYSKYGVFAQYKERCDFWEQYGEGLAGN